jgi:hypothetical protein
LVSAEENLIQRLVIRVASLDRARTFLNERNLLGSASTTQVTIAPSKLYGVNLVLVEVDADHEVR